MIIPTLNKQQRYNTEVSKPSDNLNLVKWEDT